MSFSETVFLFFLALIVFGPKKLPEIARTIGRYMNEFKRASNEFKSQIEQEIANLEHEKKPEYLPPLPAPEGTASRTTYAASELTQGPIETPKELSAPAAESTGDPIAGESLSVAATPEPVPAAEAEAAPASQEFHA
jgi:TatA/E family protein of Tat protein translocase